MRIVRSSRRASPGSLIAAAVSADALREVLGVEDLDPELLQHALTHRSYAYEHGGIPHNERLEFLGDSILGQAVTVMLYLENPDLDEGELAKRRASLVSSVALAEVATRIGLGEPNAARSGFENAARVNRALLRERFGRVTTRHLEHAATPLRVSVMRELEAEFPQDFARTAASAFRSATDISVTNSLYHYYALMTGRAVVQESATVKYIETTLANAAGEMDRLLKRRNFDFFCLNDGSEPEISVGARTRNVQTFLESYYGIPAPWEVIPVVESASSSAALEQPAG